jgi:hypothetical protein
MNYDRWDEIISYNKPKDYSDFERKALEYSLKYQNLLGRYASR